MARPEGRALPGYLVDHFLTEGLESRGRGEVGKPDVEPFDAESLEPAEVRDESAGVPDDRPAAHPAVAAARQGLHIVTLRRGRDPSHQVLGRHPRLARL